MTKSLGEGVSTPWLGCSCILAHKGGRNQQVTHESPPHNSQLVTLKLRDPPTLAWQEFERGYEQKKKKVGKKKKRRRRQQFFSSNIYKSGYLQLKSWKRLTNKTFSFFVFCLPCYKSTCASSAMLWLTKKRLIYIHTYMHADHANNYMYDTF